MPKPGAKKVSNPFDSDSDDEFVSKPRRGVSSSSSLETKSIQDLESYAVNKAEETTAKVKDCVKIAENIKEDATRTLVTLHQQGEQINRTHQSAVEIDKDLNKSETILGSLGGLFSKTWKPTKSREIKGPVLIEDKSYAKDQKRKEERKKLGLSSQGDSKRKQYAEPASTMEKVEVEKKKQDDSLEDLSNVLGQLKGMAVDMGTEIDRQNKALDVLSDDIEDLNSRVKGSNRRARRLLGK